MTDRKKEGIVVEKKLHLKNAFVNSLAYVSLSKPVLREHVTVEGKELIRVSPDNGKTWTVEGEGNYISFTNPALEEDVSKKKKGEKISESWTPRYILDRKQKVLIAFFKRNERMSGEAFAEFAPGAKANCLEFRTYRTFYCFSKDEGKTWSSEKQLIQKGGNYNETHWAEGISYEKNGGWSMWPVQLKDGTILLPVCFDQLDKQGERVKIPDRFGEAVWSPEVTATFQGRWKRDGSDIEWEMSNHLTVPEYMSFALTEPAVAELDGGKLMMVMRGNATARQTMPGVKFFSISQDRGKSWGPAVPLTYPDGSFVNSPASFPNIFRSSKNGKVYLIANILPGPARQADPRYPLQIAEVDQKYFWVLPETVTVIEDREERHPKFVRFSNWQRIEDRQTGNPVIYLTEAPIDSILPNTEGTIIPDSYRYEMKLPD